MKNMKLFDWHGLQESDFYFNLIDEMLSDELKEANGDYFDEKINNLVFEMLFCCDPDKITDSEGKQTVFSDYLFNNEKTRLVVYLDNYDININDIIDTLKKFWADDWKDNFEELESNWKNFDDNKNRIAFRGGSGYSYSIYKLI